MGGIHRRIHYPAVKDSLDIITFANSPPIGYLLWPRIVIAIKTKYFSMLALSEKCNLKIPK